MTVKTTDNQQSQSYGNFYGAVLEILTDFLIMDDVDLKQLLTKNTTQVPVNSFVSFKNSKVSILARCLLYTDINKA